MNPFESSTRRTFIKTVAGTGAAAIAASALGQTDKPASQPAAAPELPTYPDLRVAFIGTGGIGESHLKGMSELAVKCPCFCDVDQKEWDGAYKLFSDARPYQDYREMFDKEHKNFDAVMIGIPDHHHYPATILAMQHGKHCYTQKPLVHTPWEARQLVEALRRYPVATQMGNQGHAGEGIRLVIEWIRSGAIGDVKEVHTWTDRPIWPQGIARSEEEDVPPRSLNWDVWLGPAPERPFHRKTYHRFNWRGWLDFGGGALADMACHTMDCMFWALDPGYPTSVEPFALTPMNGDTFPLASIVKWQFPARNGHPAFVAYWYDGNLKPRIPDELEAGRKMSDTGNIFIGTKAAILVSGDYGESPRIFPESKMQEIGKPPQLMERSPGHMREWVMACTGEKPIDFPKSNFAYAAPLTETVLLGNIALRMNRRLEWDGPNLRVTNVPEANQYLTKDYRSGWKFS